MTSLKEESLMQKTSNDQLLKDIASLGFLEVTPHLSLTEAVTELIQKYKSLQADKTHSQQQANNSMNTFLSFAESFREIVQMVDPVEGAVDSAIPSRVAEAIQSLNRRLQSLYVFSCRTT